MRWRDAGRASRQPGQPDSVSDRTYHLLCALGAPFRYRCVGAEHLHTAGGALVVANHQRELGPIQCVLSLPRRLYPWIVADMLDPQRIAAYLYQDFVHPTLRLSGLAGQMTAALLGRVVLHLLRGIDCIAVDRSDVRFLGAFRHSLEVLAGGGALLIFPEDPRTPLDAATGMRGFMNGFVWLCTLYHRRIGQALPVIPVAVCPQQRQVRVGKALYDAPSGQRRADMEALAARVQEAIYDLYRQA
ncbi:MAG: hypothetical protein HPY45_13705 [Anaerolineae bacterium]|nr:hypothetical protein [Anaerolineae bacterium]